MASFSTIFKPGEVTMWGTKTVPYQIHEKIPHGIDYRYENVQALLGFRVQVLIIFHIAGLGFSLTNLCLNYKAAMTDK